MDALIFSNSSDLINHIINSKKFEKISILTFSEKKVVLESTIIKSINSFESYSTKNMFTNNLKIFNPLTWVYLMAVHTSLKKRI